MELFLLFLSKVVLWINQNFLLVDEIEASNGQLDVAFQSLRTKIPLIIRMQQNGNVRNASAFDFCFYRRRGGGYFLDRGIRISINLCIVYFD